MSTFLALAQKLRQETTDSGTGPSTVVGQTGELRRFVDWTADAWTELQQESEWWKWMRKSFTCPTVVGTGEYGYSAAGFVDTVSTPPVTRFSRWYCGRYDWKIYLTSAGVAGERFLIPLEWERFKFLYRKGAQTNNPPVYVSIDPAMNFCLGPKPDAIYTVSGDYQIGPQTLAIDVDIPEMPTRFHNLIVYDAMLKYGGNRVAVEAMVRANTESKALRAALECNQLPMMTRGQPLA